MSRISRNPNIQNGAYCIVGTRIPIRAIRDCAKVWPYDKILREYPSLARADIEAALNFRART